MGAGSLRDDALHTGSARSRCGVRIPIDRLSAGVLIVLIQALAIAAGALAAQPSPTPSAAATLIAPPDESGPRPREYEAVELGQALRQLAQQARINLVISDRVLAAGATVTGVLSQATALEAIEAICRSKDFPFHQDGYIYYVTHPQERLDDMRRLGSAELARALARFRARLRSELLAGGFTREEAMELLKLDLLVPENLLPRSGLFPRLPERVAGELLEEIGRDEERDDPAEDAASTPAPIPRARPKAEAGKRTREFEGTPFSVFVRLLAREAGINVLVSEQACASDIVVVRLEEVDALETLRIVCAAKNLLLMEEEFGYCIRSAKERARGRHYLDDEGLADALAAFRVGQLRELQKHGFTRAEVMEVLKADRFDLERMLAREAEPPSGAAAGAELAVPRARWQSWILAAGLGHIVLLGLASIRWGDRRAAGLGDGRAWLAVILCVPAGGLLYLFARVARPPLPTK